MVFKALYINTGKIVFLELRMANSDFPHSVETSPCFTINQNLKYPARQETLNELVGPLLNVR